MTARLWMSLFFTIEFTKCGIYNYMEKNLLGLFLNFIPQDFHSCEFLFPFSPVLWKIEFIIANSILNATGNLCLRQGEFLADITSYESKVFLSLANETA